MHEISLESVLKEQESNIERYNELSKEAELASVNYDSLLARAMKTTKVMYGSTLAEKMAKGVDEVKEAKLKAEETKRLVEANKMTNRFLQNKYDAVRIEEKKAFYLANGVSL